MMRSKFLLRRNTRFAMSLRRIGFAIDLGVAIPSVLATRLSVCYVSITHTTSTGISTRQYRKVENIT